MIHTDMLEVVQINPKIILIIQILIGLIIIIAPIIITGSMYDVTKSMGDLLVAEFVIRTLSLVTGLLVISNSLKGYSK
ncbi:hypothetical protein D0U04_22515 [Bacillus clarus]|uniref:Putative membrane protein n=2 Tax=Bacillus clarus TaxID=2338372 RepID=A0A090YA46_9BACI|nr:putative membrane protein [Bacillus clarus]RFT64339.1 hypothetical protein D0U04_22515 [Bacillus clarus]